MRKKTTGIPPISRLTARIGGKTYLCVPSDGCKGCAFERRCYKLDGDTRCPHFGSGLAPALTHEFIYKRLTRRKHGNKGARPGRTS